MTPPRLGRWIRLQDFGWLALFGALAWASPVHHPLELPLLSTLCILQILETRLQQFPSVPGPALVALSKLGACYLLIGFTGGLTSSYYLLLLFPLMSAATAFSAWGSFLFTVLVSGAYLSFLLFLDWNRYRIDPDQQRELILRVFVFAAIGYLANTLAAAGREQSKRYRGLAEQLAAANQSLSEAEAAMRRSERLAALGQLAAGLAHELRNPMGSIRASAELLRSSLKEENALAKEMTAIVTAEVDRTNSLITRFLDFSRPLQLEQEPADLDEVIDKAIYRLQHEPSPPEVAFVRNYSPEIPQVPLDSELMEQVFYNLLLNAAQATPSGGEIIVKTRRTLDVAEVSVIDRGQGIETANLESIFNPFFTTKKNGVGLGLAIVSKIVDQHGGKMAVESEVGKGSVFRVFLPLSQ